MYVTFHFQILAILLHFVSTFSLQLIHAREEMLKNIFLAPLRSYKEYLENLLEYLVYFFQRTEPLQDLDRIFSKVHQNYLFILVVLCSTENKRHFQDFVFYVDPTLTSRLRVILKSSGKKTK